jgi:hypothetical protein
VGQDGEAYKSDLGQAKTEIFLQTGLDSRSTAQPAGQITLIRFNKITPSCSLIDRREREYFWK